MMTIGEVKTDVTYFKDDLGKNLYKKKTYYSLVLEQEVLAKDKDEADNLFLEGGGINYSDINNSLTVENKGVATSYIDANYADTGDTEYKGKVVYNEDNHFAEEDGDVLIDSYADEKSNTMDDKMLEAHKIESDIDVSLNLEAESQRGK